MADSKSTLFKRVISGVLGACFIIGIGYFGGTPGLELVCAAAVVLTVGELSRMAFSHWGMPTWVRWAYYTLCVGLYILLFRFPEMALTLYALANLVFFVFALWGAREKVSNENLFGALTTGAFGLLYCVMFPYFALRLALLRDGSKWFFFLMLVVFFGDIFAYFGGRFLGKRKLMPAVSPNKTIAGSVSGLLGSAVVGLIHATIAFPDIAWSYILIFCLLCGIVAQSGDLLISLLKRISNVKDSGQIMPGHGGLLDRLDGLLIAAPLVYAFALYVRT